MLLTLPVEVLITISSYLKFEDKVNLITTSNRLHDVISKTNLYQSLELSHRNKKTQGIVKRFENKQFDGTQVKRLNIDMNELTDQQYAHITDTFPNITECKSYRRRVVWIGREKKNEDNPMKVWSQTLETWSYLYDAYSVKDDLALYVFPQLKQATMGFKGRDTYSREGFDQLHFIQYIKNMPSLKSLKLEECDINLAFLEALHESCPRLKSLVLEEVAIVLDDELLPENIEPANSLKSLVIKDSLAFDRNALFLDYTVRKYTSLYHLSIDFYIKKEKPTKENEEEEEEDDEEEDDEEEEDYDEDTNKALERKLQTYYEEISPMDRILGGYSDAQIAARRDKIAHYIAEFKATLDMYRLASSKFLPNLPKTLKLLELKSASFENTLELVSQSDVRLVKLDISGCRNSPRNMVPTFDKLEYVEKMVSLKSVVLPLYPNLLKYNQSVVSASVTKLSVSIKRDSFFIGWILSAFPSLEELFIEENARNVIGAEDDPMNSDAIHTNLRSLTFTSKDIHLRVFDYLKKTAPKLKQIYLKFDRFAESPISNINLSNWSLEKLSLGFDFFTSTFLLNVMMGEATKRLVIGCHIDSITATLSGYRNTGKLARLNISCDDVKLFRVGGFSSYAGFHEVGGFAIKKDSDGLITIY